MRNRNQKQGKRQSSARAIAVVDLGFGDAGKGTMVDALVDHHRASLVVRFNGGAQAGHNVVTPDGRHHTFSQFGAATFIPGVKTFLSRFMAIHPLAMLAEEAHLQTHGVRDAFSRLVVDERCVVTTPYHQAANRLKEIARGGGRHGSCGIGYGETVLDSLEHPNAIIYASELADRRVLRRKLGVLRDAKLAAFSSLEQGTAAHPQARSELQFLEDSSATERILDGFGDVAERIHLVSAGAVRHVLDVPVVILEGAQGVLLDEWHGFHPHTTWSSTHFGNAEALLLENDFDGRMEKMGVTRTLATRHGAGPFPTEDPWLREQVAENHNDHNRWQGEFRIGWFDGVLSRYAAEVCGGIDTLAVTHLDWLDALEEWRLCTGYRPHGEANSEAAADRLAIRERIAPAGDRDLQRQAMLTGYLGNAEPIYESHSSDVAVSVLSSIFEAPVSWLSYGPRRDQKRRLSSRFSRSGVHRRGAGFRPAVL